jgi:tetratricopeptide (TPR) repeat protein
MRATAYRLLVGAAVGLAGAGCVGGSGFRIADRLPVAAEAAEPAKTADELPAAESAPLVLTMAEELDKAGKEAEAIPYYEQARALNPALGDRAARRLAVLYDRLDHQAQAMTEFRELLKKHPKDAGLLNDIGYSYYNRGEWAEAESHLRKAVAADKNLKRAWVNLGLALAQQGRYDEGLAAFGKAVTPAEARANLGFVLAAQGKRDEAKDAYRQALALEPTLKVAQAALAKLEAPPTPKAAESTTGTVPAGN